MLSEYREEQGEKTNKKKKTTYKPHPDTHSSTLTATPSHPVGDAGWFAADAAPGTTGCEGSASGRGCTGPSLVSRQRMAWVWGGVTVVRVMREAAFTVLHHTHTHTHTHTRTRARTRSRTHTHTQLRTTHTHVHTHTHTQPTFSAAVSSGSPATLPSISISDWQPATTTAIGSGTLAMATGVGGARGREGVGQW